MSVYPLAPGYDLTPPRVRVLPPHGALLDTLTPPRVRVLPPHGAFDPARVQRFGDTPNGNRPPAPVEGQLWPRGNNN